MVKSQQPGGAALPDSPIYPFRQSWAAGRGCLWTATAEAAERIRGAADRVRVSADWCRSPNVSAESDSSTDQDFRDQLVVLSRHVIPLSLKRSGDET
jgi:hypothetical protein